MSEKCEREQGSGASLGQGQTPPTSTKSDVPPKRGRARPNEREIVGCGPEVISNVVPRGRTAQIEEAIATDFRGDAGLAPALALWNGSLVSSTAVYNVNRDLLTDLYIANCQQQPGSSVGRTLKDERGTALQSEVIAYDELSRASQSIATISGPTFAIFELADRSYRELLTSLLGSGHARQGKGGIEIDAEQVSAENSFHRTQAKEALLDDRSKDPGKAGRALGRSHGDLGTALSKARVATLSLRRHALLRSAAEEQVRVDELREELALLSELDGILGTAVEFSSLVAPFVKVGDAAPFEFKPPIAGEQTLSVDADKLVATDGPLPVGFGDIQEKGGLLTKFVQWVGGNEIAKAQARVAAQEGLATDAQRRADLADIGARLSELDLKLNRLAEDAVLAREEMVAHREARSRDGERLDRAARDRGELGPGQELHVPIATRLARVEGALVPNTQAHEAAQRLSQDLVEPASAATRHRATTTTHPDIESLRQALPPNIFRALRGNLGGLMEELGARGPQLQQLVGS